MCKFKPLLLTRMKITVLVNLVFFGRVEGFKIERRAAIKFSLKLKNY
jgi:hypothetical protein